QDGKYPDRIWRLEAQIIEIPEKSFRLALATVQVAARASKPEERRRRLPRRGSTSPDRDERPVLRKFRPRLETTAHATLDPRRGRSGRSALRRRRGAGRADPQAGSGGDDEGRRA